MTEPAAAAVAECASCARGEHDYCRRIRCGCLFPLHPVPRAPVVRATPPPRPTSRQPRDFRRPPPTSNGYKPVADLVLSPETRERLAQDALRRAGERFLAINHDSDQAWSLYRSILDPAKRAG